MRAWRLAAIAVPLLLTCAAGGQAPTATAPPPDCGSMVIIRCDKPPATERAKREASRRADARRTARATVELDRIIIEDEAERRATPEQSIGRALARPLQRQGEITFETGESAQCTCRAICPPPPLPCCACTDRVGSRLSTAPGWKPTN